jgi:crotonobetaine/carnitine-CoA ligase
MNLLDLHDRVIPEILRSRAKETPDKAFLHIGGRTYTYADVDAASDTVAQAIGGLGVSRGDRVVMMLPNRIEFLFAWFGVAKLGATVVPINPEWKGETLSYILADAEPTAMVVAGDLVPTVTPILGDLAKLAAVVVVDGDPSAPPPAGTRVVPWDEVATAAGPVELPDDVRHDDVLAILYSSGTTGRPKGIVMPHAHVYAFGVQWSNAVDLRPDDVMYTPTSLFYMQATVLGVVPILMSGAEIHIADRFSASRYWQDVRRTGATIAHAIFTLIPLLLKEPPSPLDRQHRCERVFIAKSNKEFEERFGVRLIEIYGSTESNIVTYNPWDAPRHGSAGKPSDNFDVRIVDDDDRELPQGQVGEIVCRPREPFLISYGYYRRPEVTVEAWRNLWFHCGDRGYFDEDGYLFYVDRKKDVIRRKGENISSAELERQVNSHPDVLESAAVPVPADTLEDEVMVYAVLQEGRDLAPAALIEYLTTVLPRFMVPRYVEFVDALPRTGSMKIEKFKLRERGFTGRTWDRERGGHVER